MLKDSKSRLIIKGAHRDLQPVKTENPDISEPKFRYTPMTNFRWNTQHMIVDTIPTDIVDRGEVSKILIPYFVEILICRIKTQDSVRQDS